MRKRIGIVAVLMGAAPAWAAPLDGVWRGNYTCAQGSTTLELFVSTPEGEPLALFHFGDGSLARPEGCFAMTGAVTTEGLRFTASYWLTRPYGYVSVDLAGKVAGGHYTGWVGGPGCTVFALRQQAPAPPPAACRTKDMALR